MPCTELIQKGPFGTPSVVEIEELILQFQPVSSIFCVNLVSEQQSIALDEYSIGTAGNPGLWLETPFNKSLQSLYFLLSCQPEVGLLSMLDIEIDVDNAEVLAFKKRDIAEFDQRGHGYQA